MCYQSYKYNLNSTIGCRMVEINVMTKSNFKIQTAFINEARVNALATLNELGYDANPNGHKVRRYAQFGIK